MKIGIIQIGQIEQGTLEFIQKNLSHVFPRTQIVILNDVIPVASEAYDPRRNMYYSSLLLMIIREYARKTDMDKILGVTNADLYAPQLNFVFGEAESPGKTAIASLHRLRPQFYEEKVTRLFFWSVQPKKPRTSWDTHLDCFIAPTLHA